MFYEKKEDVRRIREMNLELENSEALCFSMERSSLGQNIERVLMFEKYYPGDKETLWIFKDAKPKEQESFIPAPL